MRVKIIVEVNTDLVHGWGYEPQDYVDLVQKYLNQVIPHYKPSVYLEKEEISKETEFSLNGEEVSEEELQEALNEAREEMVEAENNIREVFGVSAPTASAILYLRGRSRWTREKEEELIKRDKEGKPIPFGKILAGEF